MRSRKDVEHVVIVLGRTLQRRGKAGPNRGRRGGPPSFYPGIRIALNLWKVETLSSERSDVIELNCRTPCHGRRSRHGAVVRRLSAHHPTPACVRHMVKGAGATIAAAANESRVLSG